MEETPASERTAVSEAELTRTLISVFGHEPSVASSIDVLRNGDEIFPAMLEAIRSATTSIEFATFVYWQGDIAETFANALAARAEVGVDVRVLIDAFGGRLMRDDLRAQMRASGCKVAEYNPPNWRRPWRAGHRCHRKTLVVDGSIAFTGGVGIAEEWEGNARNPAEWRDTHLRLTGSVVSELRSTFVDNWLDSSDDHPLDLVRNAPSDTPGSESEGRPAFVIDGDHSDVRNDIHHHFRCLIGSARATLRMTTAYFVPDEMLVGDLIEAAERGVDVHLLLPGPHTDKNFVRLAARSTMERLARHVRVSTYQPTMLHAKVLTVDGVAASIGSANINHRSSHHDQEANVVLLDPATVRTLDRHFDEDVERSVPLEVDGLTDGSIVDRVGESVLRHARPWM